MSGTELLLLMVSVSMAILLVATLMKSRQLYLQRQLIALDPLGNIFAAQHFKIEDSRNHGSKRIIVLGDSRAMSWTSPALGPDVAFVNRGIWGMTSAQVLARVDTDVLADDAAAVLLQVGVNDLKMVPLMPGSAEIIVNQCIENIREIVGRCIANDVWVLLTTIFPVGTRPIWRRVYCAEKMSGAIRRVNASLLRLESERVTILDAYRMLSNGNGSVKREYQDGFVHVNARAYQELNESLVRMVSLKDWSRHLSHHSTKDLAGRNPSVKAPV